MGEEEEGGGEVEIEEEGERGGKGVVGLVEE